MPDKRKPPSVSRRGTASRPALFAGALREDLGEIGRLERQLRDNERIWTRFRQLEVRLIGSVSLRELVLVLASEFPRMFPSVDCVTLACFDPEYELTRLVEDGGPFPADGDAAAALELNGAFVNLTQEALHELFSGSPQPRLGPCTRSIQKLLFPAYPQPLGSMALAPLLLRGQLIGTLNQGSLDARHFSPEAATDLLEHLAAVTSMCLDNAVSRERLKLYGLMDPLTGVANRRLFERRLADEIERWLRRGEPLGYMLVDVDHFKRVNDRHGHHVGDQVLQRVAQLLGRELRAADLLARYGGEEFMLLLPNTTLEQTAVIAQRLCDSVARHEFQVAGGASVPVTVSIGVACLTSERQETGQAPAAWLFEQADAALYSAKKTGRNRVTVAGSV